MKIPEQLARVDDETQTTIVTVHDSHLQPICNVFVTPDQLQRLFTSNMILYQCIRPIDAHNIGAFEKPNALAIIRAFNQLVAA